VRRRRRCNKASLDSRLSDGRRASSSRIRAPLGVAMSAHMPCQRHGSFVYGDTNVGRIDFGLPRQLTDNVCLKFLIQSHGTTPSVIGAHHPLSPLYMRPLAGAAGGGPSTWGPDGTS
jgi:hypothetical protein